MIAVGDVQASDAGVSLQDDLGDLVGVGQSQGLLELELHHQGKVPVADSHPRVQGQPGDILVS